jgi:RimJ/RimL family protein N-acetyltransferase
MENYLTGDIIKLRPAAIRDRKNIFLWLTHSNLTKEMIGSPKYPDSRIPNWDEFINDYLEFYFDGSQPLKGQCFIIVENEQDIGQINHNEINLVEKSADLDIWLSDKVHTGKGYGTEAIKIMCNYLNKNFGCRKILMSPSKRNIRAIRSYEKAGFVRTDEKPDSFYMDYEDNVILVKTIEE